MKRVLTQKVKQIPAHAEENGEMAGSLKPISPEPNRRVCTSAAMIGLAISMGASSLFLPQQGDNAMATEPADSNPISTVPAAVTEAASFATPEVKPVTAEDSRVQPGLHRVMEGTTVSPVAAASQVEATQDTSGVESSTAAAAQSSNSTLAEESQNTLAKEIERSETGAIEGKQSEIEGVASVKPLQPEGSEAESSSPEGGAVQTPSQVNKLIKAKQVVAIDRLRDSSNRLRNSLAQWKSESANTSAPIESDVPVVVPSQLKPIIEKASASTEAYTWQPKTASVEPAVESVSDATSSSVQPEAREANATIFTPLETATEPTSVSVVYQVKPGDTLGEIASKYGMSSLMLAKVNDIGNPHRLQVNQLLAIPQQESLSPTSESRAWQPNRHVVEAPIASPTQEPDVAELSMPNVAVKSPAASSTPNVPIVAALTPTVDDGRNSGPTVPAVSSDPVRDISSVSNLGTDAPRPEYKGTLATVPSQLESLAKQSSLKRSTAAEPTAVPPQTDTLVADGNPPLASASPKQQYSPYVQRLRAEIDRMREQYRHQQPSDRFNPTSPSDRAYSPSTSTPSYTPINPEFNSNRYDEALQTEIQRRTQQQLEQKAQTEVQTPAPTTSGARQRQLVAAAPIDPQTYQPYIQSVPGRMVTPELPPLQEPGNYLPGGVNQNLNGYIWPTRGTLTSGYGRRWGRMHKGIDIAAPVGTPIIASAPGVVVYARWNSGGYGNLVDIRHADGSLTRYAHNSRIFVQEGQTVDQGEQIAAMGSTGHSTGSHCHFELHSPGRGAVNPVAFLASRSR